jgi:hypothetical protein
MKIKIRAIMIAIALGSLGYGFFLEVHDRIARDDMAAREGWKLREVAAHRRELEFCRKHMDDSSYDLSRREGKWSDIPYNHWPFNSWAEEVAWHEKTMIGRQYYADMYGSEKRYYHARLLIP